MVIRVIYQFCARYSVNFTENSVKKKVGRKKSKGRSIFGDRPKSRVVDFRRPTANTNVDCGAIKKRYEILTLTSDFSFYTQDNSSNRHLVKEKCH